MIEASKLFFFSAQELKSVNSTFEKNMKQTVIAAGSKVDIVLFKFSKLILYMSETQTHTKAPGSKSVSLIAKKII